MWKIVLSAWFILQVIFNFPTFITASWTQKGSGIVVYRKANDSVIQYLLIQTSAASIARNNWIFINVRLTTGEDPKSASLRALEKKTGLLPADLRVVSEFMKKIDIIVNQRGVIRKVNYYLAEMINPDKPLKLSLYYGAYKWTTLAKAQSLLVYPDQQKLLNYIHDFLESGGVNSPDAMDNLDYLDNELETDMM